MGASLLIWRINHWFSRVVYQRDALDAALDSLIAESDWRIGMVLQLGLLSGRIRQPRQPAKLDSDQTTDPV